MNLIQIGKKKGLTLSEKKLHVKHKLKEHSLKGTHKFSKARIDSDD